MVSGGPDPTLLALLVLTPLLLQVLWTCEFLGPEYIATQIERLLRRLHRKRGDDDEDPRGMGGCA